MKRLLLISSLLLLTSCGLLNAALGAGGVDNAKTPEAKEAAGKVDESILDWLAWLLLGGGACGAGVVVEKKRAKRKASKAAFESAQKGGRS